MVIPDVPLIVTLSVELPTVTTPLANVMFISATLKAVEFTVVVVPST